MMATSDEREVTNDDEFRTQDTRGGSPQPQSFLYVMNSYAREFIFVLAVAFTAIAALQNGPPKSQKAKTPVAFFPEPSLVTDFFLGEFESLSSLILEKDISLVMYYAPWDAKSKEVKQEFQKVAKFYHHEVFFAAINCWWPDGDCSRKYKIQAYPLVIAYVHDIGAIRFEGPLMANYIIAFLDNVLSPMVTLQNTGELLELLTKHEGVLVGYFNFKNANPPHGYNILYKSSLHALSRDPLRKLCFAVITNPKVRLKFALKTSFQLYLWNRTEIYSIKTFSQTQLLDWAYGKLDQVSSWIAPPGTKSRLLAEHVEKSATLILFTPRNFLLQSSPYYDLLREVSLDYHNCNNSAHVTSLVHRMVLRRHILQEALTRLFEKCHVESLQDATNFDQKPNHCDLTCCQSLGLNLKLIQREQCSCRVCIHHTVQSVDKMKLSECENTLLLILKTLEESSFPLDLHESCQQVEVSYPVKFGAYNRLSLKCDNETVKTESKTFIEDVVAKERVGIKDDRVLTMLKNLERDECGKLKFALNYSDVRFPEFPPSGNMNWRVNFTGLGCHTNHTLFFIAMDATLFYPFAESLGIDIFNTHHRTAAVIIDAKRESSYVLEGGVNKRSLVEFVKNFTAGTLDRFLRSAVRKLEGCPHQEGNVCLRELTTATFVDYVLDEDVDIVLMYYAPWCAACSAVFHIFLSVAHYFSSTNYIKFARINGDEHDLPWEFTVERYPTIMYYPSYRKQDSVMYPPNHRLTASNLLHFILMNSRPDLKWDTAMRMCNHPCVVNNIARSLKDLRRLFRDHHIALKELSLARHTMVAKSKTRFKKFIKIKKHSKEAQKEPFSLSRHLVKRIRLKRRRIERAYELLDLLWERLHRYCRNLPLNEEEEEEEQVPQPQQSPKDEL